MGNITLRLSALTFCLGFFVCPCVGQESPSTISPGRAHQGSSGALSSENEPGRPALHRRNWRYQIRRGDVLELSFSFTPEFNQTVTVQPDGYITLRGLGDVAAEGKTLPELTQGLRAAYGRILHEPVITVDLKDFEKPYFIVGGEVWHPGKFELRSNITASAAIAIAGSFRDTAKHSQVLLIRPVSDEWAEVKVLNLKKMLQTRNLQEDPYLQPGDMLFVPKNTLSKVKPFIPIPGVGFSFYPGSF